ncbi:unnamed protein product [Dibothriocephalus latus]|uniref:Uncharacterized protein n=1 Tax=Dibothriocephalus latus TaxID=60516 RepID=A0A3P7MRK7_DIBLA|nr:unnamed protein product [Dibothriocephalus latus]
MDDLREKSPSTPQATPSQNPPVAQTSRRLRARDVQAPRSNPTVKPPRNPDRNGMKPEQNYGNRTATPHSIDVQGTRGDRSQTSQSASSDNVSSGMEESELRKFLQFLQGTINAYKLDHRKLRRSQGANRSTPPKHIAPNESYYKGTKLMDVITHALGDNNSKNLTGGRSTRYFRPKFPEDRSGRLR